MILTHQRNPSAHKHPPRPALEQRRRGMFLVIMRDLPKTLPPGLAREEDALHLPYVGWVVVDWFEILMNRERGNPRGRERWRYRRTLRLLP